MGRDHRARGAGLRLVQDADGAVLADAVGHLEGVDPQRELAGQQQVELLDGQANALARLPHQWVHLVVDADAAVARTLAGSVWEPVVLVLLCKDKRRRWRWRRSRDRRKSWCNQDKEMVAY